MATSMQIDAILDDTDALLSHFAANFEAVENDETLMNKIHQLRIAHGRFLEIVAQMYADQSNIDQLDEVTLPCCDEDEAYEEYWIQEIYHRKMRLYEERTHRLEELYQQQYEVPPVPASAWTHSITIPKPFDMTIRQQFAPIRCSYSLQSLRELARESDDEQSQPQPFIAQPVPSNTHQPLYARLVEEGKQRRDELQKELVDYYQSVRTRRVPQLRRHRCLSADLDKKRLFHAKPVPSYPPQLHRNTEQSKLERMRELLASVKEPGYLERDRVWLHKHSCYQAPSFTPAITRQVPPFKQLHRKMNIAIAKRKLQHEPIATEPFTLRINQRPKCTHKCTKEEKETRVQFKSPSTVRRQMKNTTAIDVKSNAAQQLRMQAVQAHAKQLNSLTADLLHYYERREGYRTEMSKRLNQKLKLDERDAERKQRLSVEELRRIQQQRDEAYKREIDELNKRIEAGPTLIERSHICENEPEIIKTHFPWH